MKNRLILVEGIPGSGKSTIARKIKEYFESKDIKVNLFNEGDWHPTDLAWSAYITLGDYKELLENNQEYAEAIKCNTKLEEDYAIVAYTKLEFSSKEDKLLKYFEQHEVYDGKVSLDTFKRIHFKRWEQFAKDIEGDTVVIFECSYLQNHVNELMGFHNEDVSFIMDYMINLIKIVESLNPMLIYLTQPSVYETIQRVAKERVSQDKSKWQDWIDLVIKYVECSPYGKNHKLNGFKGVIEFFEARKKIELVVIDKLSVDKVIIDNPEYNWEDVYKQVLYSLDIQ
jgi:hypothetical protein